MTSFRTESRAVALVLAAAWALPGCLAELDSPTEPYVPPHGAQWTPEIVEPTSGVYAVRAGSELLGNRVVARWVNATFCIYSSEDAIFLELRGGLRDTADRADNDVARPGQSLHFTGVCRFIRSGRSGPVVLSGDWTGDTVQLRGNYDGSTLLELAWISPADTSRFYIVGHRGGGRNSERLGRSENSLEMLRYAEILGANAVEIDVRLTRDRQAILFHDDMFSPRTMLGGYLLGPVGNFSLREIQAYGQLKYGEMVPTLRDALRVIVRETTLELVWIDVKDAEAAHEVVKEQNIAMVDAQSFREIGKPVVIVLGIPNTGVLGGYRKCRDLKRWPALWENEPDSIERIANCEYWGPRWTSESATVEAIASVRSMGRRVMPWTIDIPEHMRRFCKKGQPDGIVTNYPSLLRAIVYADGR